MARTDIQKKMTALAKQVRRTSNITTLLLLGLIAYTIYGWQASIGIDRAINILIMILVMAVNIKFYLIHANLNSEEDSVVELHAERRYKEKKNEYEQFLRTFLWMGAALLLIKLISP